MAVPTTKQIARLNKGRTTRNLQIGDRLQLLDTDGTISSTVGAALTGTTGDSFTLASGQSDGTFVLSVNTTGSAHAYTLKAPVTTQAVTMVLPDVASDTLVSKTSTDILTNKTLTTPTIGDMTNATHDHTDAAGGGAIAAQSASTGTTSNTFDVDSDSVTGILRVQSTVGGTNHTITLTNATTTAARTVTLPDLTGTVALLTGAQTFASKTLTAPVINACTITGAVTITTPSVTGTWTDLGAVTTVDINGGTVDGTNVGATTPGTGAFTTLAASSTTALADDLTMAAGKDVILAKGTGEIKINANTSGSLIILPTAATAQAVTLATAAQTSGAATVSIPDMAGVSTTFVLAGAANTFTGLQIIDMDDEVDGIEDLLTLKHTSSNNQATVADGIGISFVLENATGTALEEEWASIDVLSTTITNGSEDGDIQISQMLGGVVTPSLLLDASAQEVAIGQSSADADGMNALRIYPHTTASRGSLVLTSAINGSGDFVTTVTQATDVSESQTITIADADGSTDTFSMLATAETFSAVKTFSAAPIIHYSGTDTNAVRDLLTIKNESSGTPAAGIGIGMSFQITDLTGATVEEQASMHVKLATATSAAEDADILFNQNLAGTITPTVHFDSINQHVVIGQDATDANGFHGLRIWPLTASMGSILIEPTDNTGDDTVKITNTNTGGDRVITLPATTGTLSILGSNTFSAVQTVAYAASGTNAIYDALVLSQETDGTPAAGLGVGISFEVTDLTTATPEEQASIDASMATVTSGAEDCDLIFNLNLNGTVMPVFKLDSVNQQAVIGQNVTDADGLYRLRIYPVTTAKGSVVLSATACTGDYSTTITNADMGQSTILTIPDPGAATGTFALVDISQTFAGAQTFSAEPVISINDASNTSVTDVLQLTHTTSGASGAGIGAGISVTIENDTDATTESACIDWVTTSDGTKASLDTDVIFKTMLGGALQPALMVDASAQEVVIGQDVTDTDGVSALRIWPRTTAKGSILLLASDNSGDDTVTITNNASTSADVTITLPVATSTLSTLGLANIMSAVNTYGLADAATNTTVFPVVLNHTSSSTEAALFGVGVDFQLSDASNNVQSAGTIGTEWAVATHGSEDADMVFSVAISDGTVTEMMRLDSITSSLMLGPATGGSLCTDLIIHPATTANGSLVLHAANNASADVKTIIQNGQSGAESTFTLPTAVSGTIALTAQADGTIARSDLTEDALAVYGIPLTQIMSADGTPLGISETAGDHFLDFGTNIFQLRGEEAISETETSESYWQFILPPEYVAAGDVTVRIRCKIDGAGTDNSSTVDVEVFEQADGAIGGDIQATGAQSFAAKSTWYSKDFSVTASALVAGDILNVVLTSNVIENGASALAFYADPPKMLLDVKG